MKLINKLLPVATLGSVAAIVIPLTTSCGSGYKYNIDLLKSIDTNGWIVAEYDNPIDPEQAVEDYYKAISENHDILTHDFMWGIRMNMLVEFASYLQVDEAKFSQSSVQFTDIKSEIIDDNICLSYKAKLDVQFKFKVADSLYIPPYMPDGEMIGIHAEAVLNKVPFAFAASSDLEIPMLQMAFLSDAMTEKKVEYDWDWGLDVNGSLYEAVIKYDTEDVYDVENTNVNVHVNKESELFNASEENYRYSQLLIVSCCMFYSYYFYDTIINE